ADLAGEAPGPSTRSEQGWKSAQRRWRPTQGTRRISTWTREPGPSGRAEEQRRGGPCGGARRGSGRGAGGGGRRVRRRSPGGGRSGGGGRGESARRPQSAA